MLKNLFEIKATTQCVVSESIISHPHAKTIDSTKWACVLSFSNTIVFCMSKEP